MASNKNKSITLEWSKLGIDEDQPNERRSEIRELISEIRSAISLRLGIVNNIINTQPTEQWDEWPCTDRFGGWKTHTKQELQQIADSEYEEAILKATELLKIIGEDNDVLTDAAIQGGISEAQVIVNVIEKSHIETHASFDIEKDYNLRKLQMHKQECRGGAEVREDRIIEGRDMTYSWDSMFRKDHQPVFRPICYTRDMNGVKTFIPNVRIMMDAATEYKQPIAHHINWYPDEVWHHFISTASVSKIRKIEEEIVDTKYVRRNPIGYDVNNKPVECDTTEVIAFTSVKMRKRTDYIMEEGDRSIRVVYQSKGGIQFKGSKEIGPPAEYNSEGKVTKCWCYASTLGKDAFKYTIVGSWAEAMRKRFLMDLHNGVVNICKCLEKTGEKTKIKHQAFKTYSTRIRMRNESGSLYWMKQNVTLFCDIKPISSRRFAVPGDLIDIMRIERSNLLTSDDAAVAPRLPS